MRALFQYQKYNHEAILYSEGKPRSESGRIKLKYRNHTIPITNDGEARTRFIIVL